MRKYLTAAIAVSAVLAMSACSSSKSGGGSSSSPAGSGGGGAAAGVAAAKAYEAQFLNTPTSIVINTPLTKKAPTGKTLIGLDSGLGSAKVLAQYWKQAAEEFGWTYKDLISGATPEAQQKAMESAIQQNPNGILTSGIPIATIQAQ